jgi:hypothetical protein
MQRLNGHFNFFRFEMQTGVFESPARSDSAKQWDVNTGRTVFSQLLDFLPAYEFQKCVPQTLAYGQNSHRARSPRTNLTSSTGS